MRGRALSEFSTVHLSNPTSGSFISRHLCSLDFYFADPSYQSSQFLISRQHKRSIKLNPQTATTLTQSFLFHQKAFRRFFRLLCRLVESVALPEAINPPGPESAVTEVDDDLSDP
ncbi:hypothetical protein KQX54_019785 [Cotesia glomerata]|uniref:Uncharacterized protein n=1 Tax=Cotesia glomerata TaxID=32391 RepID=A0AAV7IK79_COTGL|nr:hypothetical protein KQX54_019785 [Cotesia glomerata]